MKIVYSDMPVPSLQMAHSVFLVGPSPRSPSIPSWRPEAIQGLQRLKYDGLVLVPEWSDWENKIEYIDQIRWERECLENCTVIVAWVPRNLVDMPAFTTNVEFGRYVASGRLFYGRPDWAPKTKYLDLLYEIETGRKPHNNLQQLLKEAIQYSISC